MILVIDIGNTTIAFTGLGREKESPGLRDAESGLAPGEDLRVLFEKKLPTSAGKDVEGFLRQAKELLREEIGEAVPSPQVQAASFSGTGSTVQLLQEQTAGASSPSRQAHAGELSLAAGSEQAVELVSISSVVPACTPAAAALAERICGSPPVIVSCRCDAGLSFGHLPAPEKVGADRVADAAWAAARYPLPVMTVDLGTATTINVVAARLPSSSPAPDNGSGPAASTGPAVGGHKTGGNAVRDPGGGGTVTGAYAKVLYKAGPGGAAAMPQAYFLGGMIGAGVRTSLQALRTGTAQLPALEPGPVAPEKLIGTDTDGCMLSAAVVGTAAMIEGIAARVETYLAEGQRSVCGLTLVLTGGNAGPVSEWIRRPFFHEPSLAAKGAALIALRERRIGAYAPSE